MARQLVIIGNGMAPGRVLDELFEHDCNDYEITIFNAEPRVNYDRIMLSPVLAGEKTYADIVIHDEAWYARHQVTLYKGRPVVNINRQLKTVSAVDGTTAHYDELIIATGSTPFMLPVAGADLDGVVTYRDLDDVETMLAAAAAGGRAVVIGGGLLGLEAAAGLKARGMAVTVVHLAPTLMERQLDAAAGYLLGEALRERGIELELAASTRCFHGSDRVESIELEDGRRLAADLVVVAAGIRPNVSLAQASDLETGRGIIVGDDLRTSDPAIFALGECAEHRGVCYGLVAPLYEMARVVAQQLRGEAGSYSGSVTSTKLKVTGMDVYSAGEFADGEQREEIVLRDAARKAYKRLTIEDNRIVGIVLFGDTRDGPWFFQQLRDKADISAIRETLIFGQDFQGGASPDPTAAVAALPPEAEICGCNGVCKGRISAAITAHGLTTLDEVRTHTKASSSCGSCTGLVEQILQLNLGAGYQVAAVQPMCGCTSLGHDEVRRLVVAKALKSIPALMQALEWQTSCGCAKCRPALNYYLLSSWPGEYDDDAQSRFINERAHANIQKDGSFSVVPRMWGGMTSASELRAIADVVDRFQIPSVKVTGGQRIDLLGVKKHDLPAVWADLNAAGLVSGHAYGKALRTVKTCVGTDWCRFGTQDSTGLGIKLEKMLWGSWTPHKVKLAVSGCPRNCAEATCKDFGVICVDSGYELHFAGAAGMHLRATEVLCSVASEDEVLEYAAATIQLYREQGRYLERIYSWVERVGVESVRELIVANPEKRGELYQRFLRSQRYAQHDPWADRAHGRQINEFRPLTRITRVEKRDAREPAPVA